MNVFQCTLLANLAVEGPVYSRFTQFFDFLVGTRPANQGSGNVIGTQLHRDLLHPDG